MLGLRRERSLSPLLSIVDVEDDLVWHKSGDVSLVYEIEAFHEPGASEDDFDRVAMDAENAFSGLPEGTTYQFLVIGDRARGERRVRDAWPAIEVVDERTELLEKFRSSRMEELLRVDVSAGQACFVLDRRYYVVATFRPKAMTVRAGARARALGVTAANRVLSLVGSGRRVGEGVAGTVYVNALAEATVFEQRVCVSLHHMGLTFGRCKTAEILGVIDALLNPTMSGLAPMAGIPEMAKGDGDEFPRGLLEEMAFLQDSDPAWALAADDMVVRRSHLRIGDYYVGVVVLQSLPDATEPGVLVPLLRLGRKRTAVCYRVEIPPAGAELAALRAKKRLADGLQLKNFVIDSDQGDPAAQVIGRQALAAAEQVISSTQRIFGVSVRVVLYEQSEEALEEGVQEVLATMSRSRGLRGYRETYALQESFLSVLPGAPEGTDRRRKTLTPVMVDMLPYWGFRSGSGSVPFTTPNNSLVLYDPFDTRQQPNPHILVTGTSGWGKSFAANYLLTGLEVGCATRAERGPYVFILDNGGSYRALMELRPDGRYYAFSSAAPPSVDPFAWTSDWCTLDEQVGRLEELLSDLLRVQADDASIRGTMEQALYALYRSSAPKNLAGFFAVLEGQNAQVAGALSGQAFPFLKGKFASLLRPGGESGLSEETRAVCFDFAGLEGSRDLASVALKLVIYEIRRFATRQAGKGHRTVLLLDESWSMLDAGTGGAATSQAASSFLAASIRMGRKIGLSVVALSQVIEDFANCAYGSAIISNASTRLIGHPGGGIDALKKQLRLTDRQAEQVLRLQHTDRFHEFLLVRGETSDVVRVPADPFSRWVFTTSPADRDLLAQAAREYPDERLITRIERLAANH